MAKNIFIDGVDTIMNFNSNVNNYLAITHVANGTCCYCHRPMNMRPPEKPGNRVAGPCLHCGKIVEYCTLVLSYDLARYFNVRNGSGGVGDGYVMHIYLPPTHPQFDEIIRRVDPTKHFGIVEPAGYGDTGEVNKTIVMPIGVAEAMKKQFPETYAALFGTSDKKED